MARPGPNRPSSLSHGLRQVPARMAANDLLDQLPSGGAGPRARQATHAPRQGHCSTTDSVPKGAPIHWTRLPARELTGGGWRVGCGRTS